MNTSEQNEKLLFEAISSLPSAQHILRFYAALISCLSLSAPVETFAAACNIASIAIQLHDDEHHQGETIH